MIEYRLNNEETVSQTEHFKINTTFGEFDYYRFSEFGSDDVHFALVKGVPSCGVSTVRVHTFEPLKDLFGIFDNTQSWSIYDSLRALSKCEQGVFVWIGHGDEMDLADALDNLAKSQQSNAKRTPYQTPSV